MRAAIARAADAAVCIHASELTIRVSRLTDIVKLINTPNGPAWASITACARARLIGLDFHAPQPPGEASAMHGSIPAARQIPVIVVMRSDAVTPSSGGRDPGQACDPSIGPDCRRTTGIIRPTDVST
jgi:hypothetical protein